MLLTSLRSSERRMFEKRLSIFTFVFTVFSFFSVSICLSNHEFAALMSFKASSDPANSLSSWINSTAPCSGSWLGVSCNPTTRRVTKVVLEALNLTGSMQPLTQLTQLRILSLKDNRLSASFLNFSLWPNLKHLYLSRNNFAGKIPSDISLLRRLHRLDLSHNRFTGEIPMHEFARLPHLLTLRLEDNLFNGPLTSVNSSTAFSFLDFNVSNNKLSGQIPASLSRFPVSSFTGNEELCGLPLPYACFNQSQKSDPVPSRISDDGHGPKKLSNRVVLMIVTLDAVAVVAALVTVACCCRYYKSRDGGVNHKEKEIMNGGSGVHIGVGYLGGPRDGEEMVAFDGCKGFSNVDDLLKSSAELLGKGSVGTTYKVLMDGGDVVVVKRVRERRKKEVDGWLRLIGGLRHCNIVNLRAYYNSRDELLLVYDYLSNGSLFSLLHGNRGPGRTPLKWTTRLKLASGSAEGLAFLHGYNKAKLFHGHLTSSNIVVDHLGNACISDMGLYQLLHSPPLSNNAYKAPEILSNNNGSPRKLTQKCDVYSFGVILLEVLTGKMATGEGETSLVKWVQSVRREEWTWEVFDFELLRYKEMGEEMVALLQVALLCLATLPKDRPKMSMVHRMIEDIRDKGVRKGGANSILNDLSSDSSPSPSESNPNFLGS